MSFSNPAQPIAKRHFELFQEVFGSAIAGSFPSQKESLGTISCVVVFVPSSWGDVDFVESLSSNFFSKKIDREKIFFFFLFGKNYLKSDGKPLSGNICFQSFEGSKN